MIYGPHGAPDFFTDDDMAMFFSTDWQVHYNSSRTGVRLNGPKAEGETYTIKVNFTDKDLSYVLYLENSVLYYATEKDWQLTEGKKTANSHTGLKNINATLNVKHELFIDMLIGKAGLKKTLFSDDLSIDGSKLDLLSFLSLFDRPTGDFNIVIP